MIGSRYKVKEPIHCEKCGKEVKRGRWIYYFPELGFVCFRCGDNRLRAEAHLMNARMKKRGSTMSRKNKGDGHHLLPVTGGAKFRQGIIDKFGNDYIEEKRQQLCDKCADWPGCKLLPVTSDGDDCPYFRTK